MRPSPMTSDDIERSKVKVRDTMLVTIDDLSGTDPGLSNETIVDDL
jgi:hypothetical protein